jgi:hypothetical protein
MIVMIVMETFEGVSCSEPVLAQRVRTAPVRTFGKKLAAERVPQAPMIFTATLVPRKRVLSGEWEDTKTEVEPGGGGGAGGETTI